MHDLVIFGSGGLAREVHQIVEDINTVNPTWNMVGFLDDDPSRQGSVVHGLPVLGGLDWLRENPRKYVMIGIGSSAARRKVALQIEALGTAMFATLVHPRSWVAGRAAIGRGTAIYAGAWVNTDTKIGDHVIVYNACTIAHDAVVDSFVTLLPSVNVSGNVHLCEGAYIGTGTQVIQGLSVGPWSIVGAGATVIRDIPGNVTAVGVPAKVIKQHPDRWHIS